MCARDSFSIFFFTLYLFSFRQFLFYSLFSIFRHLLSQTAETYIYIRYRYRAIFYNIYVMQYKFTQNFFGTIPNAIECNQLALEPPSFQIEITFNVRMLRFPLHTEKRYLPFWFIFFFFVLLSFSYCFSSDFPSIATIQCVCFRSMLLG